MQPCLTVVFWRLFRSFFVIFMFWNKMFEWSFLYYKNPSQMVKYGVFIQKKIARKRGFAFTRTLQKHGLHEQYLTAARQNVKQRSDQANCHSAQSWWSIGPEQWPFQCHFYSSQFNASPAAGIKISSSWDKCFFFSWNFVAFWLAPSTITNVHVACVEELL